MVSRSEIDMLDIRQEYVKNYGKSLYTHIHVSTYPHSEILYLLIFLNAMLLQDAYQH